MYTEPLSITIGGTAYSFPRVMTSGRASTYSTADGNRSVVISHSVDTKDNKRGESHLFKLVHRKLSTNPLLNLQEWVQASVHVVVIQPSTGFTDVELKDMLVGHQAFMAAANIDKFLGNEH